MIVKMLTVGALATNCFVVWCEESKEAIVIDPGFSTEDEGRKKILDLIDENGLSVKYIVDTHGHADHTSGNGMIRHVTDAPILIHELDAPMLTVSGKDWASMFGYRISSPPADKTLREGDVVQFGSCVLTVLHTPGHTEGGISLVGNDCIFVGDTLFQGSIGRTDFPGGSYKALIRSIREKLLVLPDNFTVYTGHGPTTTIGEEKKSNPFLTSSEAFEPIEDEHD